MVEPTIIANMGEGNVGKTESIIMVYEKLMNVKENRKDICEVIEINKVKVGIASDGDSQEIVRNNLNELALKEKCQIILIACRNNHDSVVLLNEYKNKYRIWRTSNARIYEYIDNENPRVAPKGMLNRFNEHWAEELARMIEDWCNA